MKNRFRLLAMTLGIIVSSTMIAQAEFKLESADSKSVSYSFYARSVMTGTEEEPEPDLNVETNIETTLQLNSKEPCLIFYKQDDSDALDIVLGRDGEAKLSYYCMGLLKEHPVENGKIAGVIYLQPANEQGTDVSYELYAQDHSSCIKIEEKNGKSCLAVVHLSDKNGVAARDTLVFVKDGKADQDLLWFVDPKETKAEIVGVIPVQEMTEEDFTVSVDDWSISDDVVSEWTNYTSEAEINFKNANSGIFVYGCEETNEIGHSQILDAKQVHFTVDKELPEDVLEQVYIEEDDVLMEKAQAALPKGKPTVQVYGIAGLDEKNEIMVHSETKETYEDLLKNSESVHIITEDDSPYDSYDSYLKAIAESETEAETEVTTESEAETAETETEAMTESEAETETEAMTESETEAETEVMTESETEAETEVMTESETKAETEAMTESKAETAETETEAMTESETELLYNDSETARKIQMKLNEKGYDTLVVDGIIGIRTRAAMHAFQKDTGLEISDVVTEDLLKELGIAY